MRELQQDCEQRGHVLKPRLSLSEPRTTLARANLIELKKLGGGNSLRKGCCRHRRKLRSTARANSRELWVKPSPARLRDRAEMLAAGSGLSNSLRGLRGFELCFEFKQLIHQYILVLVIVLQLCVLTIHEIHQYTNQNRVRHRLPSVR